MNDEAKTMWIVNQYAVTPSMGGATRHHAMSKYLPALGVRTVILAGTPSRLDSDHSRYRTLIGKAREEHVDYFWIPTIAYERNGVRRILGMFKFSFDVLRMPLLRRSRGIPKPDVVLGSSPHLFAAFAAWIVSRFYRVPFILEVRDLWPKSLTTLLRMSPTHPLVLILGFLERFLYKRSDAIVGLLQGMPAHVRGVAPSAPTPVWLPNGADLEDFPLRSPVPDTNDFVVAYAGAHGVPNALHVAIEAAHELASRTTARGGRYKFVLVGEGVAKKTLEDMVANLALTNVTFIPKVPRREVFNILTKADALLVTALRTKLYEGGISLNKLFEYFAAGRPVLMGLETPFDPVTEAAAGLSFAAESPAALVTAVVQLDGTSREARDLMGQNGRRYVDQHHRYSNIAATLANVVKDLVKP